MTDNLPNNTGFDLLGLAGATKSLVGPITRGVGMFLSPLQRRVDSRAQIKNFEDWDLALKAKGYHATKLDLSLGERTEVRLIAEAIGDQRNRETIAWAAIEQAELDNSPVIPNLQSPDTDWIDRFWSLAQKVSDQDMQSFWGLVLARRSRGTADFSARALEFLSTLSGDEAKSLERLSKFVVMPNRPSDSITCGLMTSVTRPQTKFEKDISPNFSENINEKIRTIIGPTEQELFGSLGIYVESGWAHSFSADIRGGAVKFRIGTQGVCAQFPLHLSDQYGRVSFGSGIQISPLGREIFGIIKTSADTVYLQMLKNALNNYDADIYLTDI